MRRETSKMHAEAATDQTSAQIRDLGDGKVEYAL
jgi:hypothetical protein